MENTILQKRHKIASLLLLGAFSFAIVGVTSALIYQDYYNKPLESKAVSYDDEEYSITLSAYEANNYIFNNLNNYLITSNEIAVGSITFTYDNMEFTTTDSQYSLNTDNQYWYFSASKSVDDDYEYNIRFNVEDEIGNNKFFIAEYIEDYITQYESDLIITISNTYYSDFKNAIELDIQANQYVPIDFLGDAIDLLVGGITGVATGIGGGLSTLVGTLAIQNNAMSAFMSIIFIFGGIALALALSRWVVNLVASLGQRNR